jgi:glutathione S-transferase
MTNGSGIDASTATGNAMILWGAPHSLYSGKVRSYLVKKGLPFTELFPSHPRFAAAIVPAVGQMVVPVVETVDGEILQDSTEIIELLEQRFPEPSMLPATPVQRCVAHLLDAWGTEGMLATAMHYRWSYRAEQEHFLRAEFGRAIHAGPDREARLAAGAAFMGYFGGMLPSLGVDADTIPAIEAAHEQVLDALDVHFQHHPYLLGGRPSIADFGFMAPLFAHLGRDPVPAGLMMKRAPNVYRWTERMNRPGTADGEFPDLAASWLGDDAIAPTLEPVLELMFRDWGPQLRANAQCVNAWLDANPALPAGHIVSHDGKRAVHPTLGPIEYRWRGITVRQAGKPHELWHFERAASAARALDGSARLRFDSLVQRLGGTQVMQIGLHRPLVRKDYTLVLG